MHHSVRMAWTRSHTFLGCALGAAALALGACADSSSPGAPRYEITSIECDPASSARDESEAFSPLGGETYAITGWSHASSKETSLALEPAAYGPRRDAWVPDASCGGQSSLEVVLVKRLVDWDKQHMQGIEAQLPRKQVRFSDVTDITLELRLRPELSVLPSPAELAEHFKDVLTPEQVTELDQGKVNLELTLFGEGLTQDHPFLNAGTIIEIDPSRWEGPADGWVRVTVPIASLEGYTEVAYQRTPADLADYPELFVKGLRINPESASGKVLRHFQLEDFEVGATPELFKEIGLSIALIELGHSAGSPSS